MSGAICPYCRTVMEEGGEVIACSGCHMEHHRDCFEENGGCTVFGCANAPAEEIRVSVSTQELNSSPQFPTVPRQAGPTPPPPPPPPPRLPGDPGVRLPAGPVVMNPPTFAGYAPVSATHAVSAGLRKSRVVFVLLALLLGCFGGHNFYAGYVKKAVIQICITLFSCLIASPVIWIWAVVEACTINCDDDGVAFI
jgi:TM2 domain-containing membrane protein YozV